MKKMSVARGILCSRVIITLCTIVVWEEWGQQHLVVVLMLLQCQLWGEDYALLWG